MSFVSEGHNIQIDESLIKESCLAPRSYSWVNPTIKLARHPKHGSAGLFLTQDLPKGTPVVFWSGRVVNEKDMLACGEDAYTLQVGENLYQVPINPGVREPADFTNSSCDPNCGFSGPVCLVTMRDMHAGEEILFDYAMSESNNQHGEFTCQCGTALCRGKFTGDDWKDPVIQERYNGYFSPYLQAKVDEMRRNRAKQQSIQASVADACTPSQSQVETKASALSSAITASTLLPHSTSATALSDTIHLDHSAPSSSSNSEDEASPRATSDSDGGVPHSPKSLLADSP